MIFLFPKTSFLHTLAQAVLYKAPRGGQVGSWAGNGIDVKLFSENDTIQIITRWSHVALPLLWCLVMITCKESNWMNIIPTIDDSLSTNSSHRSSFWLLLSDTHSLISFVASEEPIHHYHSTIQHHYYQNTKSNWLWVMLIRIQFTPVPRTIGPTKSRPNLITLAITKKRSTSGLSAPWSCVP